MIVDVFGIEAFLPGSSRSTLNRSVTMMYSLAKQWNSKWLRLTRNSKTLLYPHKALIEAELEQQKKEIIGKLEKDRFLKELLRISPLTVCSSTWVA